jgi:hypothetical protein
MNDDFVRATIASQFGGALDMFENAIAACPPTVWAADGDGPQFWYIAYHTLFFLDYGLAGSPGDFAPPAPFTLGELDPEGVMPERTYTPRELLDYLHHGRARCRDAIAALTATTGAEEIAFPSIRANRFELLLHNLRHVQHHTAQLNLLLRQRGADVPRWVARSRP